MRNNQNIEMLRSTSWNSRASCQFYRSFLGAIEQIKGRACIRGYLQSFVNVIDVILASHQPFKLTTVILIALRLWLTSAFPKIQSVVLAELKGFMTYLWAHLPGNILQFYLLYYEADS